MNLEQASVSESRSSVESVVRRAPPAIREKINVRRRAAGLAPILRGDETAASVQAAMPAAAEADAAQRCRVWLTTDDGRLLPASDPQARHWRASTTSTPRRSVTRASSPGSPAGRVVIVPFSGKAAARDIGRANDEWIAPAAFGDASSLNSRKDWSLTLGHGGPTLAVAGPRLEALDTKAGPVLVWTPAGDDDTVRTLTAMAARGRILPVSVDMRVHERRLSRLERGVEMVTRATLLSVALLSEPAHGRACYAGAVAVLRLGTDADLRDHVAQALDIARDRAWKASRRRR